LLLLISSNMSSGSLRDTLLLSPLDAAHRVIHSAATTQPAAALLAQLVAFDCTTGAQPSERWLALICALLRCAPSHAWCADAVLRVVRDACEVHAAPFLAALLAAASAAHLRLGDNVTQMLRDVALADAAAAHDAALRARAAPLLAALAAHAGSRSSLRALVAMALADPQVSCRLAALAHLPLRRDEGALDAAVRVAATDQHSGARALVFRRLATDAAPALLGSSALDLSAVAPGPTLALLTVAERRALLDSGLRNRSDNAVYSECLAMLRAWSMCDLARGACRPEPSMLTALELLGDLSTCEALARRVADALMFSDMQLVPAFHAAPFADAELLVWRHVCQALDSERNAALRCDIVKTFRLPSVDVLAQVLAPWARLERRDIFALRQLLHCVPPLVGLARMHHQTAHNTLAISDVASNDDDDDDAGDAAAAVASKLAAGIEACRAAVLAILKRPELADALEDTLLALWAFDENAELRFAGMMELTSHLIDAEHDADVCDGVQCCGDATRRWLTACQIGLFCLRRAATRRASLNSMLKLALDSIKHRAPEVRLKGAELMPLVERIFGVDYYENVVPPLELVALTAADTGAVRAMALTGCVDVFLRRHLLKHRAAAPFGGEHVRGADLLESDASLFDAATTRFAAVRAQSCEQLSHAVQSGHAVDVQALLGAVVRETAVTLASTEQPDLKYAVYGSLVAWIYQTDACRNAILLLALFDADVNDGRAAGAATAELLRAWAQDRAQWTLLVNDAATLVAVAGVLQRSGCFLDRSSLLRDAGVHATSVEQLLRHLQFVTRGAANAPLFLALAALVKQNAGRHAPLIRSMLRLVDITPPQSAEDDSMPQSARREWLSQFLAVVDDVGDADLAAYVRALDTGADQSFAAWIEASGTVRKRKQVTDILRSKRVSFGDPSPASFATSQAPSQDVFSPPLRAPSTNATTTASTATLGVEDGVIVPDTPLSASQQQQQQEERSRLLPQQPAPSSPPPPQQEQQQDDDAAATLSSASSPSSELGESAARRLSRSVSRRRRSSLPATLVVPATIDLVDEDDEDDTAAFARDPRRESETLAPTQVVPPTQAAAATIDLTSDDERTDSAEPLIENLPPTLVVDADEEEDAGGAAEADEEAVLPVPLPPTVPLIGADDDVSGVQTVRDAAVPTRAFFDAPVVPTRVEPLPHDDDFGGLGGFDDDKPAVTHAVPLTASPVCTQRHSPAAIAAQQIAIASQSLAAIRFDDLLRGFQSDTSSSAVPPPPPPPQPKQVDADADLYADADGFAARATKRRFTTASYSKRAAAPLQPVPPVPVAAATSESSASAGKSKIRALAFIYVTPAALAERPIAPAMLEKMARHLRVFFLPEHKQNLATHVVVPSGGGRTLLSLCSALRHAWLVPLRWLTQSYDAAALLPERFFGMRYAGEPFKGQRVWCEPTMLAASLKAGFAAEHFDALVRSGNGTLARSEREADVVLVLKDRRHKADEGSVSGENRRANRAPGSKKRVLVVSELFGELQPALPGGTD
jgi:hypothetical protein